MDTDKLGISKFNNINGITCYMNSILVILQQIPILSDYIRSGKFKELINEDYKNTITYQLYILFRISIDLDNANLTPSSFKKICQTKDPTWGEFQQQDSAQFIEFLICQVEEELGKKITFVPGKTPKTINMNMHQSLDNILAISGYQNFIKNEFSPFKNFFTSLYNFKTQCCCCNTVTSSFETSTSWQLPFPEITNEDDEFELYDCMNKWSENERLDDDNKLNCGFCGCKSNANRKISIWKPSNILIVHLKRFKKDIYGNICRKIKNKVNFPIEGLNISNYVDKNSIVKNYNYNLVGVNIHFEIGNMNLGHYISIVKNRYNNNWYIFNDSHNPQIVEDLDHLQHKNSYLLFYIREDIS